MFCQQVVFVLLVPSLLKQVWSKLLTTCDKPDSNNQNCYMVVLRTLIQSCYNKIVTWLTTQGYNNIAIS